MDSFCVFDTFVAFLFKLFPCYYRNKHHGTSSRYNVTL